MKLKLNRDHFSKGIQQVLNIVGTKTSMPILGHILLEAKDNKLVLTTTNLDITIRCAIQADIKEEGKVSLPARKLANIVSSLPSQDVSLDTNTDNLQIKIVSGGSSFKLSGLKTEDFPIASQIEAQKRISLKQEDLLQMLKSVVYAQSGDESRYILNGVYFNIQEEKVSLIATDGRRLSVISKDKTQTDNEVGSFILPAKTVSELIRLLNKDLQINIQFTDKQATFEINIDKNSKDGLIDTILLQSKLVDGKYPDYNQVIPKETVHRVKIERELFLECVQRAALVTSERNNSVRIKFFNNLMEISASSVEYGDSQESIAVAYEGPEVNVAFNPQYIMDPLKALTKDELFFEFKDELSPGVLKTLDAFLCVIMPLRLV